MSDEVWRCTLCGVYHSDNTPHRCSKLQQPTVVTPSYDNVIVDKPWGYEYLMFQNQDVALWCLHIRKGERTSLHCHPRKKTGFIVLSGTVTLQFLNNATILPAPANVMLRPGLFHQSIAETDAVLIEVESPVDKADLVRLADGYGREHTGYEGPEAMRPMDASCLRLSQSDNRHDESFHERQLSLRCVRHVDPFVGSLRAFDILVVLSGELSTRDRAPIISPGDVVAAATFRRLCYSFEMSKTMDVLVIS